jgi:hypothetical protein
MSFLCVTATDRVIPLLGCIGPNNFSGPCMTTRRDVLYLFSSSIFGLNDDAEDARPGIDTASANLYSNHTTE